MDDGVDPDQGEEEHRGAEPQHRHPHPLGKLHLHNQEPVTGSVHQVYKSAHKDHKQ